MALCPGLPGWAGTRKVKPIWILRKQEAVSGSSISWSICKSAPRSRQITMPAPHQSVFYRPDALPVAQPTASKRWRQNGILKSHTEKEMSSHTVDLVVCVTASFPWWVWVGECFFWYRLTRVVPGQRVVKRLWVCVCVLVCITPAALSYMPSW